MSSIHEGSLSLFKGYTEKDIQSVGLVFEPDSFICHGFSAPDGSQPAGFRICDYSNPQLEEWKQRQVPFVFSLDFTSEFTLIPFAVFAESDLENYLRLSVPSSQEGAPAFEHLFRSEAVIAYRADSRSEHITSSAQPGLSVRHGAGVLIELLTTVHSVQGGTHIYLHGAGNVYTTIIFSGHQLVLANTMRHQHTDDLRYHILYSIKTLHLGSSVQLRLLGTCASDQSLQDAFKKVVHHVSTDLPYTPEALSLPYLDDALLSRHLAAFATSLCA